jgi:3-deoxy-D-manno-octulosonic-acid transferase
MFPPGGGQNMLEPVGLGVPTLYGPYTANFRGIADVLVEHGGALLVRTPEELAAALIDLWIAPERAAHLAARGQAFIRSQQGALQATIDAITALLPPSDKE